MYTVNMADSTGLFIVFMIFCVMSITSSILLTYTCTDGTWDFDNFEGKQCVKFPEEDKPDPACSTFTTDSDCPSTCVWDTTTSSCGEPPSTNNPSTVTYGYGTYTSSLNNGSIILPKSEHFTTCSTMFFINETTTCFDKNNNGAAIKWVFTNTDNTNTCLSKISYFRVYVSFSTSTVLYYVDKDASVRHFHFKGAPLDTLMSSESATNTITFTVHAMDINNKILAYEIKKSVIANDAADTCTDMGVGVGEDWSDTMKVYVQGASESEPTKNCEGGTYVTDVSYGCQNSSGTYNLIDVEANMCGPSCYIKQDLVGYTPPTGGGSCLLTKYPFKERTSCTDASSISQEDLNSITDCVHSDPSPTPLTGTSELFNAVGITGTCSKACGTEGLQRVVQSVAVDERNTGKACSEIVTEVACNRFPCGQDCKGETTTRNAGDGEACHTHYNKLGMTCTNKGYASSIKEWVQTQEYKSGSLGPDNDTQAQTCAQKYSADERNLYQGLRPANNNYGISAGYIDCNDTSVTRYCS